MDPMGGSPASGPGISGNRGQSLPQGISIENIVLLHPGSRADPLTPQKWSCPPLKYLRKTRGSSEAFYIEQLSTGMTYFLNFIDLNMNNTIPIPVNRQKICKPNAPVEKSISCYGLVCCVKINKNAIMSSVLSFLLQDGEVFPVPRCQMAIPTDLKFRELPPP
jgi:hypothetical protein